MANRWISQNNFITSTNIHQLQSDFTIPKIERVVNKKTAHGFSPFGRCHVKLFSWLTIA
jgi:hypothetical protein